MMKRRPGGAPAFSRMFNVLGGYAIHETVDIRFRQRAALWCLA